MTPKICISLFEQNFEELVEKVHSVANDADILEIRLDALYRPGFSLVPSHIKAIKEALSNKSVRLLFTNRRKEERGSFLGDEAQRIEWLKAAIVERIDIIDIELGTEENLRDEVIKAAHQHDTKVIISFHDFSTTPPLSRLKDIFNQARGIGADIVKVVTTPLSSDDLLGPLNLYPMANKTRTALIAFSMGEIGKITRIMSISLGAPFIYCAPAEGAGTAPGQMDAQKVKAIFHMMCQSFS